MRDDDGGAVEGREQALEQRAADRVEVRLGLVEQQHVRVLREAGGERDQLALAAGERARRQGRGRPPRGRRRAASRGRGRRCSARRRPPSARRAPPGGGGRAPSGRGRRRARARPSCSATRCSSRSSSSRSGRAARTVSSGVRSSPSGCCGRNETTMPRRRTDGAGVRLLEPGEQAQHRRLAGAVRADDADAGARLDREVEPVEHGSAAERLADGVQADEGHLRPPRTTESTYSSRPSRSASARRASPEMPGARREHLVEPLVAQARRRGRRARAARSPAAASRPARTARRGRGSPGRRAGARRAARRRGASRRAAACRRRAASRATSPRAIPRPASTSMAAIMPLRGGLCWNACPASVNGS